MNQRIKFIDTAKVITAFLVVFTHLYTFDDTFRLWVYSFHMPLFFLISGMFHKQYGSIWTMIRLNAKRLLIPAVFFIFCGALVFVAINGGGSAVGCMIETARGLVIGGKIPANNVIWFLFALFWDNVLLCLALKKKYIWAIIAVCYVFLVPATYKMFHLSQALFSLPFYIIGYVLIRHQMIKDEFELKGSKVIAAIGGGILLFINNRISDINPNVSMHLCNPGELQHIIRYVVFYINGLIGTIGVLCLAYMIPRIKQSVVVSKALISVLGLQYLFMLVWDNYVGRNQSYYISFLAAIAIMVLCVTMHYLTLKYIPFVLGKFKNDKI